MEKKIAILLPYKEKYTLNDAAAASIWVKDYLKKSLLKNTDLRADRKYCHCQDDTSD